MEVRELWAQERFRREELSIIKVRGEDSVADGLTKHVERGEMETYMEKCGFVRHAGRHELCPCFGDV